MMKCLRHGASGFLLKPVRLEDISIIWQHVVRKSIYNPQKECIKEVLAEEDPVHHKRYKCTKRKKEDGSKMRVSWDVELHNKFVDAIEKLGVTAYPKQILSVMNVPWITRESVASHLQKYRKSLKEKENVIMSQEITNGFDSNRMGQCLSSTTSSFDGQCPPSMTGLQDHTKVEMTNLVDRVPKNEPPILSSNLVDQCLPYTTSSFDNQCLPNKSHFNTDMTNFDNQFLPNKRRHLEVDMTNLTDPILRSQTSILSCSGVDPIQMSQYLPNATISFDNQGLPNMRSGLQGNINSEMTNMVDRISNASILPRMDAKSLFQPQNQQNILPQQHIQVQSVLHPQNQQNLLPQQNPSLLHLQNQQNMLQQQNPSLCHPQNQQNMLPQQYPQVQYLLQPQNHPNMFSQHPQVQSLLQQNAFVQQHNQMRMHNPVLENTFQTPLHMAKLPTLKFKTSGLQPRMHNDVMQVSPGFQCYSASTEPNPNSRTFAVDPLPAPNLLKQSHPMPGGAPTAMTTIPDQNNQLPAIGNFYMPVQNIYIGQHEGMNIVDLKGRGDLDLREEIDGSVFSVQDPTSQDFKRKEEINSLQPSQDNLETEDDGITEIIQQFDNDEPPQL